MTSSDSKLFTIGRVDSVEGTRGRITRKNDLDTLGVKDVVELCDTIMAGLAQVGVAKAEPLGNRTAVSALERHALDSMISAASATVAEKLFRGSLIEGFSTPAVPFASVIQTATLGTSKQVDLVEDLLPLLLWVFDLCGNRRRWFLLPHILYHLVLFHLFHWLLLTLRTLLHC